MSIEKIRVFLNKSGVFILAYIMLSMVYLISFQYVPAVLTIEMKTAEDDQGQLFYDRGLGFRENDTIFFSVAGSDEFEKYQLKLPGAGISSVRIDPLSRRGAFYIRSIAVEAMGATIHLEKEELREAIKPLNQVALYYHDDIIRGSSMGIDPFFEFTGIQNFNRHPAYMRILILLALLLLVWGIKRHFSSNQGELFFALFLLAFALPALHPFFFSLILAILAITLFAYLLYKKSKAQPEFPIIERSAFPGAKWLDNKTYLYRVCFCLILLLAFLLRFINLTNLDPYTDEYSHILAAAEYLDTGLLEYCRASMVTYLNILFFRLGNPSSFHEYLFWGRLPGVIFSALTVIPLYLITRRISPPVALISIFLWATSPWAIGVARTIREYAYFPFFIMLGALSLIYFFELLLTNNIKLQLRSLLCLLPVIALVFYAFRIDPYSTLRISLLVYAGITAYYLSIYLYRFKDQAKKNKIVLAGILAASAFVARWMFVYAQGSGHIRLDNLRFSDYWLQVFFFPGGASTPLHWWGDYHLMAVVVFILGLGFFYAAANKQQHRGYFLHAALFSLLLLFYTLFFDRYYRPRYIFYALPFFIPLVAVSVYALFDYANKLKPFSIKVAGALAVAMFLFQIINYNHVLYPVLSDTHGFVRTTNEHHDSLKSTLILLEEKISPDDVFITTIARTAIQLNFNINSDRMYYYSFKSEDRFNDVAEIIEKYPRGFMILDWRRNGHFAEGFPTEGQFLIGDHTVEVIQNKDGMHVYRWQR